MAYVLNPRFKIPLVFIYHLAEFRQRDNNPLLLFGTFFINVVPPGGQWLSGFAGQLEYNKRQSFYRSFRILFIGSPYIMTEDGCSKLLRRRI